MPKAAPAAGAGIPVAGDHSNAMELASPVVEDEGIHQPVADPDKLGSHREDDAPAADDAEPGPESDAEVPARLKGKSLAQVYQEFAGLEQAYSRQGNELGESRALLRQALEQALKPQGAGSASEDTPDPTDDDFATDPKAASRRLFEKETKPLREAVATAEQRMLMLEFNTRHPGYIAESKSEPFQKWVSESPFRTRMFKAAANFDLEAAEELFSEWEKVKPAMEPEKDSEPEKHATIRRQRTETGGSGKSVGSASGKKIYKSSELARLYTTDRDRYNAMADEIRLAFAEGRVR